MACAVCDTCQRHWRWRARRGSKLASLKCTECGSALRAVRRSGPAVDDDRTEFPLGATRKERVAILKQRIADTGLHRYYRSLARADLHREEAT